jgi:hypothetical protein
VPWIIAVAVGKLIRGLLPAASGRLSHDDIAAVARSGPAEANGLAGPVLKVQAAYL